MRRIKMKNKLLFLSLILVLTFSLMGYSSFAQAPSAAKDIQSLPLFQADKFDAHYRVPRDVTIEQMLVDLQVIKPDTAPAQIQGLVQQYKNEFIERNPTTPNPKKLQKLLEK